MYARILADVAPMISNTAPRSHTCVAMSVALQTSPVVSATWTTVLVWWAGESWASVAGASAAAEGPKKFTITSRQTKASRGRVVSMFSPKQKRATLTRAEEGKLLSTLPSVREPKVRKPERAMARQAKKEMMVLMWVRREKRVRVGVEREE